jgi:predicted dienelactone hydrolase
MKKWSIFFAIMVACACSKREEVQMPLAGQDYAPNPLTTILPVGVRTVELLDPSRPKEDGTPRRLVTEIWYPAGDEAKNMEGYTYDPLEQAPDAVKPLIQGIQTGVLRTSAVRDAPVRKENRPFPLVIFSHGAYAIRFQNAFFTVALASHGYIVLAPDHEGNTLWDLLQNGYDPKSLNDSAFARPVDVEFLVTKAKEWDEDPKNDFYGAISLEGVGVSGHSFGGYTALAVMCRIPNLKAILAMSPAAEMTVLGGCLPEEVFVPIMIMGGEMDKTLDFKYSMEAPWEYFNPPKFLVDVKRAGHYSFTDLCRFNLTEIAEKAGYPDAKEALGDGCGAENWDYEKVADATRYYGISFMNTYLRNSALSMDYVTADPKPLFQNEVEVRYVLK